MRHRAIIWARHLAWIIVGMLLAPHTIALAELRIAPGQDIGQAINQNPLEELFLLEAGSYPGFINIANRKVEIRGASSGATILTGGEPQMIAQVIKDGHLRLRNVSLQIKPGGGGLFVKQGRASLHGCQFSPTDKTALYVDSGHLSLRQCQITHGRGIAILGFRQAVIDVDGSQFIGAGAKGTSLFIQKGSRARVRNSRFMKLQTQAIYAADNARLRVSGSQFLGVTGNAITLSRASRGLITDSQFQDISRVGLLAAGGSWLTASSVDIDGVGAPAVQLQGGGGLSVLDSRLRRVNQAIVVLKGKSTVSIIGNAIQNINNRTAIYIEGSGKADVSGNLIDGGGISIRGSFDEPVRLSENQIWGGQTHGLYAEVNPGIYLERNVIAQPGKLGILLHKSPKNILNENIILNPKSTAVFLQYGATFAGRDNLFFGGTNSVVLGKQAGIGSFSDGDFFVQPSTGVGLVLGERSRRYRRALENASTRQLVTNGINRLLVAKPHAREEILSNLRQSIISIRDQAQHIPDLQLEFSDMVGNPIRLPTVATPLDRPNLKFSMPGGRTFLPPGAYRLQVSGIAAPLYTIVQAGVPNKIKQQLNNQLQLTFNNKYQNRKWQTKSYVFSLKSKDARAETLKQFRHAASRRQSWLRRHIKLRRPGLEQTEIDAAVNLARETLAAASRQVEKLNSEIAELNKDKERNKALLKSAGTNLNSAKAQAKLAIEILSAFGTTDDIPAILNYATQDGPYGRDPIYMVAAWIEARLGRLNTGQLINGLASEDLEIRVRSAKALNIHGSRAGERYLIDFISQEPRQNWHYSFIGDLFWHFLDRPNEAALKLARETVDILLRRQQGEKIKSKLGTFQDASAAYLIAYGTKDDVRKLSKITYFSTLAAPIAPLLDRPADLAEMMADHLSNMDKRRFQFNTANNLLDIAALCTSIRRQRPDGDDSAYQKLRNGWIRTYGAQLKPRRPVSIGTLYMNLALSNCIPRSEAAKAMIASNRIDTWLFPWLREHKNNRHWEFEDWKTVKPLIEKAWPTDATSVALRTARWKLTHYRTVVDNPLPDGSMRLARVLWRGTPPTGGLSIIAHLKPEWIDKKLRLTLSFDLDYYRHGSLAETIANDTRTYRDFIKDRGLSLVTSGALMKKGQSIALTRKGGTGVLVFESKKPLSSLDGLEFYVDLDMFGTKAWLHFPLFASDRAYLDRREGTQP